MTGWWWDNLTNSVGQFIYFRYEDESWLNCVVWACYAYLFSPGMRVRQFYELSKVGNVYKDVWKAFKLKLS